MWSRTPGNEQVLALIRILRPSMLNRSGNLLKIEKKVAPCIVVALLVDVRQEGD